MKVWGGLRETSELWWDLLGLVAAGRKPLQPEPGGDMRSSCWHMEGVCSCRRWLPDRSCSCWWRTATTANAVGKERGAKYPNIFLFLTLNPLPGMAIGQNRQEPEGKEAQLIDSRWVSQDTEQGEGWIWKGKWGNPPPHLNQAMSLTLYVPFIVCYFLCYFAL